VTNYFQLFHTTNVIAILEKLNSKNDPFLFSTASCLVPTLALKRSSPVSHCVRRRTSTYAGGRTDGAVSPYIHERQCTATYSTVRRRRSLQMLNYMLLTVVNGHGDGRQTQHMPHVVRNVASVDVRRRSVCVNAAVEIKVLDYNVAVCQRTARSRTCMV